MLRVVSLTFQLLIVSILSFATLTSSQGYYSLEQFWQEYVHRDYPQKGKSHSIVRLFDLQSQEVLRWF